MQSRDKGQQKMEIPTAQLELKHMLGKHLGDLKPMLEYQLNCLKMLENQHDETNKKLLEESKSMLKKQSEELKQMLENQHDEANTKLLVEHKQMFEKKLEELENMPRQKEANTKLLEEPKKMLRKQLEELERMIQKQQDEANTKLLEEPIKRLGTELEELKLVFKKQHDDAIAKLSEEAKEHKRLLERQIDRIDRLETTAFQLTNFFFVSQAVVFSALAGDTSSIACYDVWFPLGLSLLPAILNMCAFVLIRNKYRKAITYRDQSSSAYEKLAKEMHLKRLNINARNEKGPSKIEQKNSDANYFDRCMFGFCSVSVVIALGSYWRLCR